jgi:hypothetical protein
MGFLRRRSSLETELSALQTRRDLLTKQLATTEARLDEALTSRRARLLEGDDLDAPHESPVIERLRDERAAVVDALTSLDVKLLDAQQRLAEEQDHIKRDAAVKELAAVVEVLTPVHDELAAVAAKVAPALSAVLVKLPPPHSVLPERVGGFLDGVLEATRTVASEAQSHSSRLVAGDAQVVREVSEPVIPPAPKIERQEIFLLQPSCWRENGEVFTAGTHCTASPPVEIARLALQFGHAIETGGELAVTLQMRQPPCYAHFAESDCVDISQPKQLTKAVGSPTAASAPMYSEFVGMARVGTARVARI